MTPTRQQQKRINTNKIVLGQGQEAVVDELERVVDVMQKLKTTNLGRVFNQLGDMKDLAIKLKGEPGEKGPAPVKGEDYFTPLEIYQFKKAVTPIKGVDYFTPAEIKAFKAEVTPVKGVDYYEGRDGKDGAQGKQGLRGEPGPKGFDGRDGKNAPMDEISKMLRKQELLIEDLKKEIERIKVEAKPRVRWKGGGGSGLSVITVSGTINDANTSFTAASAPTLVVVNGATYRNGSGCTIAGLVITLDNPVGTGGDIYALG